MPFSEEARSATVRASESRTFQPTRTARKSAAGRAPCAEGDDDDRDSSARVVRHGVPRCGSLPGGVRPKRDEARRARDARPDVDATRVRRRAAAPRRAHHGIAAHDDPDRRADRDAGRARRRGALGVVQHLLDPGSRRRRGRRRPGRDAGAAARSARVRLEGRDPGGVLVVHRAGADLAGRRPEHAARRRWRRHDARAQGPRVREGRSRARSCGGRIGGVPGLPHAPRRRRSQRTPASGRGSRRTSAASRRRPRRASTASTRWRRPARCCSRRSTSTTPSRRASSTTSTAAGTRSSTGSTAPST